ncbi:acyltransferase family protein, partial [Enterobacter kobei]|uniref:acyltransferase family protein n=1 Tax=Enterobacter kobei TaxID=208224 RepID=UPI001054E86A
NIGANPVKNMNVKSFREDINGLRALAVLSVVAFHYSDQSITGGFAGVDVFFVISGFLMTSIIFRGLESNTFSIWSFLKARAKRIVPALTAVVTLMLIAGYLCFDASSYQLVGKHALSSLTFVSNFIYQSEAGYFDTESKGKALLHTWSLSVEWQFYILYPIVIYALSRIISLKSLKLVILVSALVSFTWCAYITMRDPVSSYFMLYSRAWEMMLGGIAFIYPIKCSDNRKKYIEIVGLGIILLSLLTINESIPWPGYIALLPVFGAYLCILANNKESVFSGYLIRKVGLWSYSIYLVHWPVLVILHKLDIQVAFQWYLAFVLFISFIIYECIEKRRNYGYGAIACFMAVIIASWYVSLDGVASRVSNQQYKLPKAQFRSLNEGHLGLNSVEGVQYFNADDKNFDYILIGDSHARHYYAYFKSSGLKVASLATDGCEITKHFMNPLNWSEKIREICKNRYTKAVEFINAHPGKKVIWAMTWRNGEIGEPITSKTNLPNDIISEMDYFINDVNGSMSDLYIIGDTQGSKRIMYECLASMDLPINRLLNSCETHQEERVIPINKRFIEYTKTHKNVHFIDPTPALCSNGKCIIVDGNEPVYTDTNHLTRKYSIKVGEYIFSKIKSN